MIKNIACYSLASDTKAIFACFLMQEHKKGLDSEWCTYIRTLPSNFDHFPCLFDADDKEWLGKTQIEDGIEYQMTTLTADYAIIFKNTPWFE